MTFDANCVKCETKAQQQQQRRQQKHENYVTNGQLSFSIGTIEIANELIEEESHCFDFEAPVLLL